MKNLKFSRFIWLILLSVYAFNSLAGSLVHPQGHCYKLLVDLLKVETKQGSAQFIPTKRYPYGFEGVKGKHLQYGFESEYTLNEIEGILKFYSPDQTLISKGNWSALSSSDKVKWVQDNIKAVFPQFRTEGKLVLVDQQLHKEFKLPKKLIRDETGNIEIVLPPFDTLEDWQKSVVFINKNMGEGSMQSTVSVPREVFFQKKLSQEEKYQRNIGFLSFYSDYDAIEKLTLGFERWSESQERRVARSFEHPFLGPLNKNKFEKLKSYLLANAEGEMYEDEAKEFVASSDASFKYFGGTAYRPDIASPKRVVFEVRDAHNKYNLLFNKVLRNTQHLMGDRESFVSFARMNPFDPIDSFNTLPENIQRALIELFPNKAKPGIDYTKEEIESLEVARNFAWPLRDWSGHLEVLPDKRLTKKINTAQNQYREKLEQIIQHFEQDKNKEKAAVEIQGALVTFVHDSQIRSAFLKVENAILERAQFNKLLKEVSYTTGAIRDFFPAKMMTGEPMERLKAFMSLYPGKVTIVEDVKITIPNKKGAVSKPVVIVSTSGMKDEDIQRMTKDYITYFSYNNVSFPLNERQGHLHTRVGNTDLDWYGSYSSREFSLPTEGDDTRLETFLFLKDEEFFNLRTYISNVEKNGDRVLGDNDYDGSGQFKTNGKLNNNKITNKDSSAGHNCTSWICTAPIGHDQKTLYQLTGASKRNDIHTNPGWWTNWVAATSKEDRSPFVIITTNESIQEFKSRVLTKDNQLDWDFNLH